MSDELKGALSGLSNSGGNDALMGALSGLSSNPIDPNRKWGAFAAGVLAPKRAADFGESLSGGLSAMNDVEGKQEALKASYVPHVTQALLEAAKLQQQRMLNDQFLRDVGGSQPQQSIVTPMPGQFGSGTFGAIPLPNGMPQIPQSVPQQRAGGLAGLTPEQVAFYKMNGKDLGDLWKTANEGFQEQPGTFRRMPDGSSKFIPDLKNNAAGFDQSTNSIIPISNFNEIQAGTEGAKTDAQEKAKARYDLVKPDDFRLSGEKTIKPGTTRLDMVSNSRGVANSSGGSSMDTPSHFLNQNGTANGLQGLDVSKLSPQQKTALARKDPEGYARSIENFYKNQYQLSQQPTSAPVDSGLPDQYQTPEEKQRSEAAIKLQTQPLLDYQTKRAYSADKEENDINSQAQNAADFSKRISDMRTILSAFDPNSGTPTRKRVAEMAQASGMPDNVVNKIAGGDLAALQTFQKLAVTNSMEALKSDMENGRITQAEFQIYKDNNPNIGILKSATENIFNRAQERNKLALDKQKAYVEYKKKAIESGHIPDNFSSYWNNHLQDSGVVKNEISGGGDTKTPNPVKNLPFKNSNGWILHTDSQGNKAYVSPDRKQFQEVK